MTLQRFRSEQGFTLVELIMVIVIIGILASVAVPKFVNLTSYANTAKCEANRGAMASAIAMNYARLVLEHKNDAYDYSDFMDSPACLDSAKAHADWFAGNVVPRCSKTGEYTWVNCAVECDYAGH
ncbi:MAG: type II secretion system protein [Calditrichota bacterium]